MRERILSDGLERVDETVGIVSNSEFIRVYGARLESLQQKGVRVDGLKEILDAVALSGLSPENLKFYYFSNGDRYVTLNLACFDGGIACFSMSSPTGWPPTGRSP